MADRERDNTVATTGGRAGTSPDPLDQSTIVPGVRLGAYRLLKKVGSGGMGAVWMAEHVALKRRAAIKVLRRDAAADPETVSRFFNEARAAAAIADPGIVQIFDFGHHDDGSAYIVMELLDGEPLDVRLTRLGRLPYRDAMRIMRQVTSSLAAAHRHGIIHRDLKPQNLFLVRDPEVPGGERAKLLDFGIAKLARDELGVSTDTHAFMGTPLYMAPEQCRDAGAVDERSDIYALGCVMYLLVTGRPVFQATSLAEMLTKHLYETPARASTVIADLPAAVDALIARCLAKDPADRFATGAELAAAIVAATGGAPFEIVASPASSPPSPSAVMSGIAVSTTLSRTSGAVTIPRSPSSATRTRVLRAAAGGAVLLAVTTATLMTALRGNESSPSAAQSPETTLSGAPSQSPAPPATPTVTPIDPPPVESPAVTPPVAPIDPPPDPAATTRARIALLGSKVPAWARSHRGGPCPTIDNLAAGAPDAMRDAWGQPIVVTCSDQPVDQIVGLVSVGPDGVRGTADDLSSWLLGGIAESLRGPRWAPAKHSRPHTRPSTERGTPETVPGDRDHDGIPDKRRLP